MRAVFQVMSLLVTLVGLILLSAGVIAYSQCVSCAPVLWSASFESGTQSEFNYSQKQEVGGAKVATSSHVQYDGAYSGYYYYVGPPGGGESRRAYPTEVLSPRPSKFLVEEWVYVPSNINGQPVLLTDWVSFISLWLNEGGSDAGINPITVDSTAEHELTLWLGMLPSDDAPIDGGIVDQAQQMRWSFDRWFKIGILGDLEPGTANSRITLFQDDVAIMNYVGNLLDMSDGLGEVHNGLYTGTNQGTFAVYNDAITVRAPASTVTLAVQALGAAFYAQAFYVKTITFCMKPHLATGTHSAGQNVRAVVDVYWSEASTYALLASLLGVMITAVGLIAAALALTAQNHSGHASRTYKNEKQRHASRTSRRLQNV